MLLENANKDFLKSKFYHVVVPTFKRSPVFLSTEFEIFTHFIIEQMPDVSIVVYNILSDHGHFLIHKQSGYTLPQVIQKIKGRTSYYLLRQYPTVAAKLGRRKLWARGYHFTEINTVAQFEHTVSYITNNYDKHKRAN